jgi:hypothetical protein
MVALLLVVAACTPLDGRSPSVEVGDARPDDGARAEVPWWVTTTTTTPPGPSGAAAPSIPTPDAAGSVAPAADAATAAAAPTTVPADTTTTTAAAPVPVDPMAAAPSVPAAPETTVAADAGSDDVVAAALSLVRYDWAARLPGWELRFLEGRRGVRGLTYSQQRLIEIFVRPGDSPAGLAHVVAHELGHAVDLTLLSPLERDLWRQGRGQGPGTVWFPSAPGQSDFATGAGDFAEAFAWLHGPGGQWSGELGPPPSASHAVLMAVLIDPST